LNVPFDTTGDPRPEQIRLFGVRLEAGNGSSLTDRHSESVITEPAAMISATFRLDSTGRNLPKTQALFGCLPA